MGMFFAWQTFWPSPLVKVDRYDFYPGGRVGALPPVAVHELAEHPVGMGVGRTPKGNAAGDARAFLRSLRSRTGGGAGETGQSGHAGCAQHFPPGDEGVFRRAIFSHAEAPCVAVWAEVEG
jgi:hypothetical protein